jgi:ABC-type antimicrobial peptide transport system permease subunit
MMVLLFVQIIVYILSCCIIKKKKYQNIGTWFSEKGYVECVNDPFIQNLSDSERNLIGGCSAVMWGTVTNALPMDRASPAYSVMPKAYRTVLIILAVLLFIAFLFFSYCMLHYRATRLLKASQIPMVRYAVDAEYIHIRINVHI